MANLYNDPRRRPQPGDPDYVAEMDAAGAAEQPGGMPPQATGGGWNAPPGQPMGGYGGYDNPISSDLRQMSGALGSMGGNAADAQAPPAQAQPPHAPAQATSPMQPVPQTLGALAQSPQTGWVPENHPLYGTPGFNGPAAPPTGDPRRPEGPGAGGPAPPVDVTGDPRGPMGPGAGGPAPPQLGFVPENHPLYGTPGFVGSQPAAPPTGDPRGPMGPGAGGPAPPVGVTGDPRRRRPRPMGTFGGLMNRGRTKRPGTDVPPGAAYLSRSPVPPGAPAPPSAPEPGAMNEPRIT
jgi:hypothetical protein